MPRLPVSHTFGQPYEKATQSAALLFGDTAQTKCESVYDAASRSRQPPHKANKTSSTFLFLI
jgi:hypothetical protein